VSKRLLARSAEHPDLPPHERPVPPDQVELDELVHVFRIRTQRDGRLVFGAAAVKIGLPKLPGIDFAAVFYNIEKKTVMRRKFLKKPCLLI
jgi:hypothetical protein